uniref:Uncharacterized protein n=1 Tax=Atrato Partiti-like virus 5 TaxID=2689330 RepID=A0A6B9KG77_9VIRU|nr:hypothetical protein [Atrato Partiti-like virus 5]
MHTTTFRILNIIHLSHLKVDMSGYPQISAFCLPHIKDFLMTCPYPTLISKQFERVTLLGVEIRAIKFYFTLEDRESQLNIFLTTF